jgi:hypothetical protein
MASPLRIPAIPIARSATPQEAAPRRDKWYLLSIRRTDFKNSGRRITTENMKMLPTTRIMPRPRLFIGKVFLSGDHDFDFAPGKIIFQAFSLRDKMQTRI